MAERYGLADLVGLLGMQGKEADAKSLITSGATKAGLDRKPSWTFDDAVEILNAIAAGPGLSRVLARCAIARLHAGRARNVTA